MHDNIPKVPGFVMYADERTAPALTPARGEGDCPSVSRGEFDSVFSCTLDAGHGGTLHIADGMSSRTADWPVQSFDDRYNEDRLAGGGS